MRLHLVFELVAGQPAGGDVERSIERMPSVEKLIARGDAIASPARTLDQALVAMFGYDAAAVLPNAALLALGEGLDATDGYWLRADPVCLLPTTTRLTLRELPAGTLSPAEAQALSTALIEHLAAHDFALFTPHPQRWYLRLAAEPDLRTLSPAECAGTLQESSLPAGRDGPQWRRMITEAQMLLHEHPVNAAREAQGNAPANAIWPWGGGRLPSPSLHPPYDGVWSGDVLARGLARAAGITVHALPQDAQAVLTHTRAEQDVLVVLRAEAHASRDAAKIDRAWAARLLSALEAGQLAELTITAWSGGAPIARRIERSHLRRWWRLGRALQVHG